VGPDLELLTGFLVHVGRSQHTVFIDRRRQGDGPGHPGARALGRIYNLFGGLVK